LPKQRIDQEEHYKAIIQALREAGYKSVTEADVESVCQQMVAGKKPGGVINQFITEFLYRRDQSTT